MDDALRAVFGKGVIGIGAALDGVEPGVDVVPGRRAHRRRLETVRETHPLGGEFVDVRRMGLPAVAADIAESAVIGDYENEVGFGLAAGAE